MCTHVDGVRAEQQQYLAFLQFREHHPFEEAGVLTRPPHIRGSQANVGIYHGDQCE